MSPPDQTPVIAFLARPETWPGSGLAPSTLQTHISLIFRVGPHVYKLKRALRLPYLDFSTPQKRYQACLKELELNRRTAPFLYLAVRQITTSPDGGLEFDGAGELVDAVLQMRRFDEHFLLAAMAERHELTPALMTQLARSIAGFHGRLSAQARNSGAQRFRDLLQLNSQSQVATVQALGNNRPAELNKALATELEKYAGLLDTRALAGKVRHCHGDMHLGNICVVDDQPTLFDCLEFNDEMATVDVLYDLAFLLMDLWRFQEPSLANWVMNRYLDEADEVDGLPLMPFFMALRAAIRAQVLATQLEQALSANDFETADRCKQQATQFLDLGFQLLEDRPPRLMAVGGLSGSGKSTVAGAVAHGVGRAPGARVLSSDRLRKQLFGVTAETQLPTNAYTPQVSEKVYKRQAEEAARVLKTGSAVIADAVFSKAEERHHIQVCAKAAGVPFVGVWLQAPPGQLLARVAARQGDPSDATQDVVQRQLASDPGAIDWHHVQSDGALKALVNTVMQLTI